MAQDQPLRVGIPPYMLNQDGQEPIVVEIPRNTSPDQIQEVALAQARAQMPKTRSLGMTGGPDQSVGFTMPTGGGEDGVAQNILDAFPQLAGMIAQFTPMGRTYKGAGAVPAIVESVMKALRGEDFDPVSAAGQGVMGMAGKGVGDVIGGVGRIGTGVVRRSLGLKGDLANRTSEEVLPKLAIREKAKMTIPGVDAVAAKANATGSGGLSDLAEAMEAQRLGSSLGPNETGGGIISMLGSLIKPPKQLAIGSAMAAPFGVNTAETIAPVGETSVRALMAWLASQMGDGAPQSPQSGPRRRTREQ